MEASEYIWCSISDFLSTSTVNQRLNKISLIYDEVHLTIVGNVVRYRWEYYGPSLLFVSIKTEL